MPKRTAARELPALLHGLARFVPSAATGGPTSRTADAAGLCPCPAAQRGTSGRRAAGDEDVQLVGGHEVRVDASRQEEDHARLEVQEVARDGHGALAAEREPDGRAQLAEAPVLVDPRCQVEVGDLEVLQRRVRVEQDARGLLLGHDAGRAAPLVVEHLAEHLDVLELRRQPAPDDVVGGRHALHDVPGQISVRSVLRHVQAVPHA
eukprot:CAMPEP_0179299696 /NCGR_PEP_ID=MMETSP0797-20121207/46651_1 /TAXON_ID=47934 /ORGANISM="Dinophysis acuminata, Strain DAEP01" /LENGTH=205 /DNA_ID=CAMNT_0021009141 /DNA_START=59 /DNA_END=672 /DNA_ORIENTATION=+